MAQTSTSNDSNSSLVRTFGAHCEILVKLFLDHNSYGITRSLTAASTSDTEMDPSALESLKTHIDNVLQRNETVIQHDHH